jgi:hypothetical protein
MKRIFSWLVFVIGLAACILGLAAFGARPKPGSYGYLTEWIITLSILILGLVPLAASLMILKRQRAAALTYAAGTVGSIFCGLWIWLSRVDGLKELASLPLAVAGLFAILSTFWWFASQRDWPPLLSRSRPSWKRKAAMVLVGSCMLLMILLGAFRLGISAGSGIDCNGSSPFAKPTETDQAVFVARTIVVQGWPARLLNVDELPFGIVEKPFWGLPWWDQKIVLIGIPLLDRESYFVDGTRMHGFLTQFLPIIELRPCSRTNVLRNAAVDMRVLNDGPPRVGVRIIGRVVHWGLAGSLSEGAVGVEVSISGLHGSTTVKTDEHGIYEVSGLPPGRYVIVANTGSRTLGVNRCATYEDVDLKPGDVWGCDFSYR